MPLPNTKDWTGNKNTAYVQIGASNHSLTEREANDFYATDPKCALDLLEVMPELNNIWECACGEGHLAKEFDKVGKLQMATDLITRGYGIEADFLIFPTEKYSGDIVTNPPYSIAEDFLLKAMELLEDNRYYCAFLKLTWLEGKKRKEIFKQYPPKFVFVYSGRQNCAKNGKFEKYKPTAIAYCWYVWQKGFTGNTIIKWI